MIRRGPAGGVAPLPDASVRLIRTLAVTVFLEWFGATSIVPMLPVYIRHLGGTDALAGLVMASFFAAGVLFQYPVGRLSDRIGRKPVLVAGLVVYAAASFAFLAHIVPAMAILLRGLQGLGAGASAVAALAMVSGSVARERRGRAFASIYGAQISGMAVGPLIGAIVGVRYMWAMFLASGVVALVACIPALRIVEPAGEIETPAVGAGAGSHRARTKLARVRWNRSMAGAMVAAAALGLTTGIYDICWTLLMVSRGATGWEIGVSWTLFAVPFVVAARPSGWLADHMDRRYLVLGGVGLAMVFCAGYPFIPFVPLLMILGGTEALGFAAALPSLQSLLTQGSEASEVGRIQGMFGSTQTACTAVSAALAGAAFAYARWLPFLSASAFTAVALVTTAVIWRKVPGHVHPALETVEVEGADDRPADGVDDRPSAAVGGQAAVGVSSEVQ
jgi:DHA1 family multidrug resistance protein-like MFS transporter